MSLEDLTAKVKDAQEKMESTEADIAEAEATKAAIDDISEKSNSFHNR